MKLVVSYKLDPENGQFFFSTPQTIILCDALIEPNETKRGIWKKVKYLDSRF